MPLERALLPVCLAAALSILGARLGTEAGGPQADPLPQPHAPRPAGPQGIEDGWLGRAQRGLAEREYQASRNRAGLQAPNRAHDLRTYFEPSGIRVHDRTAAGSPELLSLSLSGVGRADRVTPVGPAR
jgi:hypothetical protein